MFIFGAKIQICQWNVRVRVFLTHALFCVITRIYAKIIKWKRVNQNLRNSFLEVSRLLPKKQKESCGTWLSFWRFFFIYIYLNVVLLSYRNFWCFSSQVLSFKATSVNPIQTWRKCPCRKYFTLSLFQTCWDTLYYVFQIDEFESDIFP